MPYAIELTQRIAAQPENRTGTLSWSRCSRGQCCCHCFGHGMVDVVVVAVTIAVMVVAIELVWRPSLTGVKDNFQVGQLSFALDGGYLKIYDTILNVSPLHRGF